MTKAANINMLLGLQKAKDVVIAYAMWARKNASTIAKMTVGNSTYRLIYLTMLFSGCSDASVLATEVFLDCNLCICLNGTEVCTREACPTEHESNKSDESAQILQVSRQIDRAISTAADCFTEKPSD